MLRLCTNSQHCIETGKLLVNNLKPTSFLGNTTIIQCNVINKYPPLVLFNEYVQDSIRHRGGKVANKMRVLEKRKRREQEKLAKISQNSTEFIKLSNDVSKGTN